MTIASSDDSTTAASHWDRSLDPHPRQIETDLEAHGLHGSRMLVGLMASRVKNSTTASMPSGPRIGGEGSAEAGLSRRGSAREVVVRQHVREPGGFAARPHASRQSSPARAEVLGRAAEGLDVRVSATPRSRSSASEIRLVRLPDGAELVVQIFRDGLEQVAGECPRPWASRRELGDRPVELRPPLVLSIRPPVMTG